MTSRGARGCSILTIVVDVAVAPLSSSTRVETGEHAHTHTRLRGNHGKIYRKIQRARAKRGPRGECQRRTDRRHIGADTKLHAFARPETDEPTEAGEQHALLEPSGQHDAFGDRRQSVCTAVEPLLELPAELRNERANVETVVLECVNDAVAQHRETDAGTGEADRRRDWRRQRLTE